MFLGVKNLGKIETADIIIDAVTVIAGENNSGKSTVGKILFCIFNSFYRIEKRIKREKRLLVRRAIRDIYTNAPNRTYITNFNELTEFIIENKEMFLQNKALLHKALSSLPNFEKLVNMAKLDEKVDSIQYYFEITDEDVLVKILQKKLAAEFNMQINNLHHPERESEIVLGIKDAETKIRIRNNENIDLANSLSLNTEVIYIDDPFAIDKLQNAQPSLSHQDHLRSSLRKSNPSLSVKEALDEIITAKKLDQVFEKLDSVCPGEMVKETGRSFAYGERGSNSLIDMMNVSTGLKTFMIIKTLLLNGCLEENGTIVLDEPEIHLHPEWQLIFAELIVLIQKEFNMHILINTHSPYFLNAIEVYSHKHGIAKRCKYYLAEVAGSTSRIIDVSDKIEKIYEKLARPLQNLENESYRNA